MKKNRFSLATLLAVVLAVGGAFATHEQVAAASVKEVTLYWYNATGGYVIANTKSAEIPRSGCPEGTFTCEQGFAASQLKNPAQPSMGPKAGEVPQVRLHQP